MGRKVVVTCAVTGSFDTVDKNPAVPVTPEAIARSALDAASAGAAVAHIHVRNPETGKASMAPELYREAVGRIRDSGSDVVINLTTGAGARFEPGAEDPLAPGPATTLTTPEKRMRHVEELRPEICSLDVATMNFGEHAFVNIPRDLRAMAARAHAAGTKPEVEVFDLGHIALAKALIRDGHIAMPALFQLCLGIPHGAPATPETMIAMRDALPDGVVWSAFGISRHEFPMAALATMLGGHVRVGLEDNLYLEQGVLAPSNAALVERAVSVIELMGGSMATPKEAREIFGVAA